ncbi:hypothetical protein ACEW7V_00755, partial [Areca yellow leaf disease phytoplasma]|uniref:hypothetical protein n=1 Tax=Areca yellow leaf disease phytoplasma TaxID=927614 RepID=UPI0035B547FD
FLPKVFMQEWKVKGHTPLSKPSTLQCPKLPPLWPAMNHSKWALKDQRKHIPSSKPCSMFSSQNEHAKEGSQEANPPLQALPHATPILSIWSAMKNLPIHVGINFGVVIWVQGFELF